MKKGFFCGVFDLFHFGHILALRECRAHCDHLTVAVNRAENIDRKINPNKKPPLFPFEHRFEILKECRLIDTVVSYNSEDELKDLLKAGHYDIRFLGADYQGKNITGPELTGEVHFLDRSHGLSTTGFKDKLAGK